MNLVIIKKKIKNSYIRVLPNLEVRISVPKNSSQYYISSLIDSKREWIEQKLDVVSKKYKAPLKLIDNEVIIFLGEEYLLKVKKSEINKIEFDANYILMYTKNIEFEYKKKLFDKFLLQSAKNLLNEIVINYQTIVKKNINCVKIRKMRSRWGSCNHYHKNINLNSELIKKPLAFIEYVVLHELAHLTHPNHSREFYGYIEQFMPDWKQRCNL